MRVLQFIGFLSLLICGCDTGPSRIPAPGWKPEEQASRALELLDKNQNGVIDADELVHAPGLASALWHLDKDGDKGISRSELETRLKLYKDLGVGLMSLPLKVTLNGRPLPNATVRLLPEQWLSDVIEPASGKTDRSGTAYLATETEDVPGVRVGYYRVEVESTHLNNEKAAKSIASLGVEASPVTDGNKSSETIRLAIKY